MRGQEVFVLDTNVLIFAPEALEAFSDAEIVIPINVIEELDRFKAELSDRGGSARLVSQRLDELRELGSLAQGIQLQQGGKLRVELQVPAQEDLPAQLDINRAMVSNGVIALSECYHSDIRLRPNESTLGIRGSRRGGRPIPSGNERTPPSRPAPPAGSD